MPDELGPDKRHHADPEGETEGRSVEKRPEDDRHGCEICCSGGEKVTERTTRSIAASRSAGGRSRSDPPANKVAIPWTDDQPTYSARMRASGVIAPVVTNSSSTSTRIWNS